MGAVLSTDADDTLGFVPKQQRGHRHQRLLHPGDSERDLQADWLMLRDTVDDLLAGLADPDGFQAALGALHQAASNIDHQALLDTPHVPGDAGEYRERLAVMLARIPDGWGRWISCSRGWYPVICELDEQLVRLFPAYRIHQVKEKFAGLRYYWEAGEQLTDPADPEPEPRAAGEDDTVWGERWDAWRRRQDEYSQTPEGQARAEDARLRGELAERTAAQPRPGQARVRWRDADRSPAVR